MKILITGSDGRIGQKLSGKLAESYDLILASRETASKIAVPKNAKYYKVDITKDLEIGKVVSQEKPDMIVHLAGIMGPICEENPDLAYQVNVAATKNLALIAAKNNVKRFIFSSSAAVYPQNLNKSLKEEDANPQNIYGKTKLEAEMDLEEVAENSGMQVIVLRIFNIYGPGFDDSLVNKLLKLKSSIQTSKLELVNPDRFYRDYIHIDDVIKAFAISLKANLRDSFNVFNVASGEAISTTKLIELLKLKHLAANLEIRSGEASSVVANVEKAQTILNFKTNEEIDDRWII